jgi:exoribonuclease R
MQVRMVQRNFTLAMVDAILDTGDWNDRGDQLVMDQRQGPELDQLITEKRRKHKRLGKELRELERLRGKGRVTVVATEGQLITVYRNAKQG